MTTEAFGADLAALLRSADRLNDGSRVDCGWGSLIMRTAHGDAYGHGGWWPGCATYVIQVPQHRRSCALVAFTDDQEPVQALARRLVGLAE